MKHATARLIETERPVSGNVAILNLQCGDRRIAQALAVLSEHYSRPDLDVAELANRLNLSSSGFRHLFTKVIGVSPCKYVRSLRLERACELLRFSFLTVKQLSSAVGYSDASRFSKDFTARYSCSPREYRKRSTSSQMYSAEAAQK